MKFSEMTNEQGADAAVKLTEYVGNIIDDAEMKPLLTTVSKQENTMSIIDAVRQFVPLILKKHRSDYFGAIGALLLKSPDEVSKMKQGETWTELKESLDKELISFFDLLLKRTKTIAD